MPAAPLIVPVLIFLVNYPMLNLSFACVAAAIILFRDFTYPMIETRLRKLPEEIKKVANEKLDETKTYILKQKELAIEKYKPIVVKAMDDYNIKRFCKD